MDKEIDVGPPAYRKVAQSIEDRILRGEISPGQRLPSELRLAADLNVHRSTVREAIRVLEQDGLVRRKDGKKKLFATVPRASEHSKRLVTTLILNQIMFEELWETLLALEPAAADGAARRRTDRVLEKIEANLSASAEALRSSESLAALDVEFHELVAEAAGNRALELARRPLADLFYPAFYAVMSRLNAGERLLFAHRRIYEAIRDGERETAREWMEKHIRDFRRGYELANLEITAPVGAPVNSAAKLDTDSA